MPTLERRIPPPVVWLVCAGAMVVLARVVPAFVHLPAAALVVPVFVACIDGFQLRPEERVLVQVFGPPFEACAREVPRWLRLPGWRARVPHPPA